MMIVLLLFLSLSFPLSLYAEDIRDIKPPVEFLPNPMILYGVVAAAVGIVTLFVWFLWKRRPKRLVSSKLPSDRALEQLEQLRTKNYPTQGLIKEFYSELSLVIRQYIEERFDINAPEMTTQEFLEKLKTREELTGEQKNLLKEFLNISDMVKFAKYGPGKNEAEQALDAGRNFIEGTKLK